MAELGGGIDPLEVDLLESPSAGVGEHGFSEGDDTLLDTGDGALDHDVVVLDLTVADEATETVKMLVFFLSYLNLNGNLRSDGLLGDVEVGRGVALVGASTDAVNLVVNRGTVVVTGLTSTSNSPLDVGRMPGTDTSNLAETLVRLARKLLGTPAGSDTGETVTLGDSNAVDHLILLEDGVDLDGLLEEAVGELDLGGDIATVDLDLHQVGLLLLERSLADLGVGEDTDNGAVLLHALELTGDGSALGLGVLLGVLGESLLLRAVPVLVEATLDLVGQMLSPDGGERAETAGSLNITDNTDGDHRRRLDDGDGLNDLLLVHLGTGTVKVTDDGGHTGLVAHGGRQVDGLLGVILGEAVLQVRPNVLLQVRTNPIAVTDLLTLPR